MNEFRVIKEYFSRLAGPEGFGLKDDVAILEEENNLAFSTDTIIENVHFLNNSDPYKIALKLMGASLSDLAAKGLQPKYYSLNLSLNEGVDENWLHKFSAGLNYIQNKYHVSLLGGDTTRHDGNLVLSSTVFGSYEDKIILRSGAETNDLIWVTGNIGDSFLGLKSLTNMLNCDNDKEYFIEKYERPLPRFEICEYLNKYANASIDVSDGLIQDLNHLLISSNKGAFLHLDNIPKSKQALEILKLHPSLEKKLPNGGDDYEIIFTSNSKYKPIIKKISEKINLKITEIGVITNSGNLEIINSKNQPLTFNEAGYNHFDPNI